MAPPNGAAADLTQPLVDSHLHPDPLPSPKSPPPPPAEPPHCGSNELENVLSDSNLPFVRQFSIYGSEFSLRQQSLIKADLGQRLRELPWREPILF
ncbi:unnamed protein product [Linum trigynum]|uniref:Uncharacterized protein n=1 Tax=Linum trigynum TaxID=586398 RepID=A0AAV2F486_9ROSI